MNKIKPILDKIMKLLSYCTTLLIFIFFYIFMLLKYNVIYDICIQSVLFSGFLLTLIYLIMLGITKKSATSNLIMIILLGIFSIVNIFKVYYTNDPILFSDILFINSSSEILDIINGTILDAIKNNIISIIVYILISIGIGYLSYKNQYEVNKISLRVIFIIIPIAIFTLLLLPTKEFRNFMLNKFYNIDSRKDFYATTTNLKYYAKYGTVSGMYEQYLENLILEPTGYNEKEIKKEVTNIRDDDKSFKKPNIIVVFAESFWDIDQLDEVTFDKEVTSNFNKLKEEGIFFNMISPSYGGISANVEFEFLTGANLAYFGKGYVPYMQLYTNDSYYNRPSIIQELENNDYYTKIEAYTSKKLFNCGKFYEYIGVDSTKYNTKVAKKYKKGKYVSDEHVIDQIIEEFDNKEPGKREFYMTLTMQAHMPYKLSKYKEYDVKVKKSNLSKEMNDTLQSYAQGIYDTDKQLGRLYEYIQTLDEPTMIVFYGDHLPYLDTNGKNILDELEYFNTKDQNLNNFRKYNTQSLILANFKIKEDNYKYIGPDLLSAYVLNRMDIKISDYYKWLYTNINILPTYNGYVAVDQEGNTYNTKQLPKELKNNYDFRNSVQYKYFIK